MAATRPVLRQASGNQVSATHTSDHEIEGDVTIDERNRTVTWTPKRPLQPACREKLRTVEGGRKEGQLKWKRVNGAGTQWW
eukprot:1842352-Rhodomonas_salina.2